MTLKEPKSQLFNLERSTVKLTDTAIHPSSTMEIDDSGWLFPDTSSPRFVNTYSNTMEECIIYLEAKTKNYSKQEMTTF